MRMIDFSMEHGSISGYVVYARKSNIQNYLAEHTSLAKSIAWKLAQRQETVALLRNLYVDPEHRGQGVGSALVVSFLEQAELEGATCFVLISDDDEEQINGLDLNAWYEGFGFCGIMGTGSGPLMVMPDDLVEDMAEYLGPYADDEPQP